MFLMEISEINDDELLEQARQWRLKALRGDKDARGIAHELECEVRRRWRRKNTSGADVPLDTRSLQARERGSRRAWSVWRPMA